MGGSTLSRAISVASGSLKLEFSRDTVQWAGTTDPEVVRKTKIGMEVANLSGGSATLLPNHHLSKPVYIGEIRPDGQYNVMWHSAANVDGNPWFDPTSSDKAQ